MSFTRNRDMHNLHLIDNFNLNILTKKITFRKFWFLCITNKSEPSINLKLYIYIYINKVF